MLSVLATSANALTPPAIRDRARRAVPEISLSTVYRHLKSLVEEGGVLRVELPGQPVHFEALRKPAHRHASDHHHHFHCNACDRIYPIDACPGPMKDLVPRGFRVDGHEIVLHGRCAQCAATARGAPARAFP